MSGESKPKGTILKDSFYKQRLSKTSNHIINGYTTQFPTTSAVQSDTDEIVITPEEQQLDFGQHLSNLGKTACGTTFAFRDFICTHKRLPAIHGLKQYQYLECVDLSFNSLNTLKHLSGLKFLTSIKATNNQLTTVLDIKEFPHHLDCLDLSNNRITAIPHLGRHRSLRILKLNSNKITAIKGLQSNKSLRILDLSQNLLQEIGGLDNLGLRQLYLSNNQIDSAKGVSKLQHLRILNLSVNKIRKLGGLVNLVSLRDLNLAKNNIKHVRQVDYLQNLMYLNTLDLSYNPLQERKYYRLQLVYKLPTLQLLDGSPLSGEQIVLAQSLYGLDVEQKYTIFKTHLPEEQFIDRRIHKSELAQAETDSEGENNNLVDQYDQEGRKTVSNSKNSRFNNSKRSNFSKGSKYSKGSSFEKH